MSENQSIKQKVKYTAPYTGTISSTEQNADLVTACNTILNSLVTLITTNNPQLSVLTRITYGTEQMTGAPLYDKSSLLGQSLAFQSDVAFIGTNKNNIVLSLCVYGGRLVVSMNIDPSVEQMYIDNWENLRARADVVPVFACGKAARYINTNNYNAYNINLPLVITNDTIELSVVYWTGTYSSGYAFYNGNRVTNDVDLVFYKTIEDTNNTAGIGCALWRYSGASSSLCTAYPAQILAWSFNENLSNNLIKDHILSYRNKNDSYSSTSTNIYASNTTVLSNGKRDFREWFATSSYYNNNSATSSNWVTQANFLETGYCHQFNALFHTLGNTVGNIDNPNIMASSTMPMPAYLDIASRNPTSDAFISPVLNAYNLPVLDNSTEAYFRKVHIPGYNVHCKGELYLMYSPSPVKFLSGDIIETNDKHFAVINEGIVCWTVRV